MSAKKKEKVPMTVKEAIESRTKDYEVIVEKFGTYKKGDEIKLVDSTAAPLIRKKLVKLIEG